MATRNSGEALNHRSLMNLFNEIVTALKNACYTAAGLAIGDATKKTISVNADLEYMVDGVLYNFTRTDDSGPVPEEVAFTATTHDIAANASSVQEACYLVTVDDAGTFAIVMGDIATGAGNALVPATPEGVAAVGYARIAVDAGSTIFNATTDDLDASHLTVTYVDTNTVGLLDEFAADPAEE